ncbi:hypothetical protein NQ317_005310, partial [Molorchus minor]
KSNSGFNSTKRTLCVTGVSAAASAAESAQTRGMQLGSGKLQHISVISVNHADADKPPSLYLAPMASQNYLFGSLTDGDTDADRQKVAIFVCGSLESHFYHSKTNIGQALSMYYFMRILRIAKYNFNPMLEDDSTNWMFYKIMGKKADVKK